MAFTTNLLAPSTTAKMDGVSHFFSVTKSNDYLARRLSQTTTRRVKTSSCYCETSLNAVMPFMMPETETRSDSDGIGIVRFLKGKSYFVTGATGFLAKVLIEKLLTESPEIGKIFLLMKSNDQESANKRLYDEIDAALNVNALGPGRLLTFGKKCKKLKLFLHFSTAYVTGKKEGTVLETPLCIGENITGDLNIELELKLASEAVRKFRGGEEIKKLKKLGMERAQHYGWENTYTFTKAMGETVIHSKRGDLPVVIIRPSIIESSYKEPFPGWIQGFRMCDPIILAYGKGQISNFWADYQSLLDVIPVDMVANATIAAMAKHGCVGLSELNLYNVTSTSHVNPLRFGELMDYCHQHLRGSPLIEKMIDLEPMKLHSSFEDFSSFVSNKLSKHEKEMDIGGGRGGESKTTLNMKSQRKLKYFQSMARVYEPYMFVKARFEDTNTKRLIQEMSMEERKMFEFDVGSIDWEHYIVNIHITGLKRQLFPGRSS